MHPGRDDAASPIRPDVDRHLGEGVFVSEPKAGEISSPGRVGYVHEIAAKWKVLVSSALGIGTGLALGSYTQSLFGPYLIAQFGWAKEDYALLGTLGFVLVFCLPLAGRLVDRFSVRKVAGLGIAALTATYCGFAMMGGGIGEFFGIYLVHLVAGSLTSASIYTRVIVQNLTLARGIGLSIVMTGPPLMSATVLPLLGMLIDAEGWRAGYWALAGITASCGILVLILIPPARAREAGPKGRSDAALVATADSGPGAGPEPVAAPGVAASLRLVFRRPAFRLLVLGMFLINLPQVVASSQLSLVLQGEGASPLDAIWLLSLYPLGMLAGRFACGILLDRAPAHIVSALGVALPAAGFLGLASGLDPAWFLALCVLAIGAAQGAEGDVAAFLTAKHVGLADYGLALGLVMAMVSLASALGAVLLSVTLRATDAYSLFVVLAAAVTLLGAGAIFLTGRASRE